MSVLDTQFLGLLAPALTLVTFISRDMLRLRLLALAANMSFIAYGLGGGLWPVATLHLLLVPVNLLRLLELQRGYPAAALRRWPAGGARACHLQTAPRPMRQRAPRLR